MVIGGTGDSHKIVTMGGLWILALYPGGNSYCTSMSVDSNLLILLLKISIVLKRQINLCCSTKSVLVLFLVLPKDFCLGM